MPDLSSNKNYSQFWTLIKIRLIEFTRQPEAVFWVYFFPILMVVVLGFAFRTQTIEQFEVDVAELSGSPQVLERLEGDEQLVVESFSEDECRQRLRTGKTSLVILSKSSTGDEVEYLFDPSRPGSLNARAAVDAKMQTSAGRVDMIKTENVKFEETGARYVDFLVPGLLGMSIMGGGLFGVGFAIVDMRIKKLLKRIVATPMKKSHFLYGIIGSRLVYMVPQIVVLAGFAWLMFGVKIHGNWLALAVIILLGSIQFCGIGILIACRAKTLEAASGIANLVMLPLYTLSGIFFSYERFPEAIHPFIQWLPLTPLIDALRSVWLDGASLASQWYELLIILVWCVGSFVVGLALFRWRE